MNKFLLIVVCFFAFSVKSQMTPEIIEIQNRWAIISYQTDKKDRVNEFKKLAKDATAVTKNNNKNAAALIWEAVAHSTYAREKNNLGALKDAKYAKKIYEKSLKIDPMSLRGGANTGLGTLYYKVPGWPLSFGSSKKARKYLLKGLQNNPKGIDANFYFAEFLYEQGEYNESLKYLVKAKNSEPRANRKLADIGMQQEIELLMTKVKEKLN